VRTHIGDLIRTNASPADRSCRALASLRGARQDDAEAAREPGPEFALRGRC
jgi:hypothetical protein